MRLQRQVTLGTAGVTSHALHARCLHFQQLLHCHSCAKTPALPHQERLHAAAPMPLQPRAHQSGSTCSQGARPEQGHTQQQHSCASVFHTRPSLWALTAGVQCPVTDKVSANESRSCVPTHSSMWATHIVTGRWPAAWRQHVLQPTCTMHRAEPQVQPVLVPPPEALLLRSAAASVPGATGAPGPAYSKDTQDTQMTNCNLTTTQT